MRIRPHARWIPLFRSVGFTLAIDRFQLLKPTSPSSHRPVDRISSPPADFSPARCTNSRIHKGRENLPHSGVPRPADRITSGRAQRTRSPATAPRVIPPNADASRSGLPRRSCVRPHSACICTFARFCFCGKIGTCASIDVKTSLVPRSHQR